MRLAEVSNKINLKNEKPMCDINILFTEGFKEESEN